MYCDKKTCTESFGKFNSASKHDFVLVISVTVPFGNSLGQNIPEFTVYRYPLFT